MLNIALPKGRLGDKVYGLFSSIGYDCAAIYEDNRKLVFENPERGVRYLLVKPSDVAIYVEHGAADIGVVGKDVLLETQPDVYELLDLQLGRCRLAVAAKNGWQEDLSLPLRVATKYPRVAKRVLRGAGPPDRDHPAERQHRACAHSGPFGCDRGHRGNRHDAEGERSGRVRGRGPKQRAAHCKQGELSVQRRRHRRHLREVEGKAMIRVFKSGEVARADILYRGESGSTQAVEDAVADILADVKKNGDAAVLRYCEKNSTV